MLDIEVLYGNPSLPAVAARDFYCLVEMYLFFFPLLGGWISRGLEEGVYMLGSIF